MSTPLRAPARRPGAPPPDARRHRLLALTASAAAGLGLILATGSAARAATATADTTSTAATATTSTTSTAATATTKTATAHTFFVAPNGTDSTGSCGFNSASNAFPTIQDALACAVSGDAISLAPTGSTPTPVSAR